MNNNTSTLQVQGFTPYAQIPRWVIQSGDGLSHVAVRLYGAIMTYADNDTHTAFPARETLAEDIGVSVATVKRSIKELEVFKALKVTRRRNKRTGNFYANHYTLVFEDPRVTHDSRPQVTSDPISKPTTKLDPNPFTSEQSSDHLHVASSMTTERVTPIDALNKSDRLKARYLIIKIALHIRQRGSFWDPIAQDTWQDLMELIENRLLIGGWDPDMDLMDTWTISGTPSTPYEAGVELNKILHYLSQ